MGIRDKQIICDETNNPPATCDETLNIRVNVQFDDQPAATFFMMDLPIDLGQLRAGTLRSVPVIYPLLR
jgi:hypothetical protein